MMLVEPVYASEIIVMVVHKTTWNWYVSNYVDWFLDRIKYSKAHLAPNEKAKSPEEVGRGRFDIPIVNEHTAEQFITAVEPYRVTTEELRAVVAEEIEEDYLKYTDCYPSLLVDFNQRRLISNYPESAAHEIWAPDGWDVQRKKIVDEVPSEYKYWIIDGRDVYGHLKL